MNLSIGEKIKSLRNNRNWSLRELESRTHISYSVLSRIEAGKRPVVDSEILTFARVFSVSPNELFGYEDPFEKPIPIYVKLGIPKSDYDNLSTYQHEVLDWAVLQENLHFKNQSDNVLDMMERLEIIYEYEMDKKNE